MEVSRRRSHFVVAFLLVLAGWSHGACSGNVRNNGASCADGPCGVPSDAAADVDAPTMDGSLEAVECGTGAVLTPAQWQWCTAPRSEPHEIDSSECGTGSIGDEYQVVPSVFCVVAPNYHYENNPRLNCDVQPFCMQHADCTDAPRGRCVGTAATSCSFPEASTFLNRECSADSQCDDVASGWCSIAVSSDSLCDPTGACRHRTCAYRQDSCSADSDCSYLAGGFCQKSILYAHCEYHDCLADADCASAERCTCNRCIPSACSTDTQCEPGQVCRLGLGCFQAPLAYACSTSMDQCDSSADCNGLPCEYTGERWQCGTECPIPP